jgi:CBS domain-containing protein
MVPITARDIMTADPVTVGPGMSVKDAARLMTERHVGALPVIEEDKVVGLVTEGDLIMQDVKVKFPTTIHLLDAFIFYPPSQDRMENELKKAVAATVGDVMTREPVAVAPDAGIEDVATLMVDRDVSRVLVTEAGRLVGIVSKSDIVRTIATSG